MKGNIKLMKKLFNVLLVLLLSMGVFTSNKVVEAEESFTTKYAVQIYGIEQDELEDGSTAGLTFGPALGQDFMNTYISHTPTGTTSSGHARRCVHNDEWETIARWNHEDPYVYEQCISNNCTHSVKLTLSDIFRNPDFVYGGSSEGDGVGHLVFEMQNTARNWNAWGSLYGGTGSSSDHTNAGGWGASNIRAVLNGVDSLTTTDTFAQANNITSSNALISAFPTTLQDAIGFRKTLYDSVYNAKTKANLKTSYDKLWLLSSYEMGDWNSIPDPWAEHTLEAPNGKYQKFIENNLSLSTTNNDDLRTFYQDSATSTFGSASRAVAGRWLRSSGGNSAKAALIVTGGHAYSHHTSANYGIAPCFSLSRLYIPSYDPADPLYDPQADEGNYTTKRGINASNEWVKNGNTWTYTFDVFDDSIPYYIWEDKIPGYTSSVMKPNKDLMNQNGEKYYEIINRSTTLGSLNITKTTDAETEDRFEFTITLEGNGLEGAKVFSNVIFTDGVGKIKLGKDESKLIEGLPAGVTYTVEETPYSDYITTSTGEIGTIVANETQEVSFHNEKVPVKNLTAESGFKVKKVVEGNNEVSETFDFIAQINAGEPNKLINLSNGESITTDASGLAIYEFSLANDEELIFSNLSTGASYQVTEKAGEYISSYNIQDLNEGSSINQSANENTTQNLALSTAVETLDVDEEIEITFTNRIIKKQNLKVAKQVNGNAEDKAKQYEITVELYGLDPMATLDSDAGRFVADEDGYAIKTILLRDGEEFMIPEVPVGTQYVITESPSNTYAAYEITDANGGSDFIKNSDSNDDINLRLATQMETVNENEEATVKFINTSQVTLKLEKVVDGNMGNKEDEFEFDVKVMTEKQNRMIDHGSFTTTSIQNYLGHYVGTQNNLINYSGEYLCAIIQDNKAIVLQNNNDTIVQLSEQDAANTYAEIAADYTNSIPIEEISVNFNNYNEFIEVYNTLYAEIDNVVGSSTAPHNYIKMRYNEQKNKIIVQVPFGAMFVGNNAYDYFVYNVVTTDGLDYINLSQYGGVSNGDGSYRFTLKHGDNLEIAKAFPGYNYEITEVDYSGEGYRTYPNNSMIQGRTISGVLNENTNVKMRNIRGGAVPTEIRFYIPIGIPALIVMVALFVVKQRRKEVA